MNIAFMKGSLLGLHLDSFSVHFGVFRDPNVVYKEKDGSELAVECDWIWGFATEQYDHCLEYFGLGPFLLVCWLP